MIWDVLYCLGIVIVVLIIVPAYLRFVAGMMTLGAIKAYVVFFEEMRKRHGEKIKASQEKEGTTDCVSEGSCPTA